MLPAAAVRLLLPVSVSVIYLICKYLRSGNNDVDQPSNSGNNDVVPYHARSDRDLTILEEEILKDNHVLLDKIRALEPAVLDELRKIKPAVLREMVFDSAELDPAVVDAIRKLSLKGGKEAGDENENGNLNETESEERDEERSRSRHYRVRPGAPDCLCYLETGTCKFGPNCKFNHPRITTENNQNFFRSRGQRPNIYTSPNPSKVDTVLQVDPAELDPAIIDVICKLSLKEKEEGEQEVEVSCSRPETEIRNKNGNKRQSEKRDGAGEENKNENGGEEEKKVGEERSRSQHYPVRPEAGEGKTGRKNRKNNQNYFRSGGQRPNLHTTPNPGNDDVLPPNPGKVDTVLQVDPAELDPAIIDAICKLSLKEKEEGEQEVKVSCTRPETEIRNKNGNKRQSEERDGGGGENKNENGGQVEKKVDDERSRRHHYPVRPPGAGDSSHILKTATHKFGSNCKFNRTRRSKNNQVSEHKMKEREGFAEKPGQTECKNDFRSGGRHPNLHATANPGNDDVFSPNPGDPNCENGNGNEIQNEERDKERSRIHHSVRFEAGDCWSYLKTGTCKFGPNCKFNHPRIRKNRKNNQNYFRSGGCKPRNACSFNPRRGEPSVAPVQELNFMDLPIRPGEKDCSYYMKYGSCKSETNCKFNHPDPTAIGESGPPSGYIDGGPASVRGPSSSTMIPPSQGIPSKNTEWNGSQDPEYLPERSIPAPPPYVMNNAVTETNIYEQNPQPKQVEEFPERPGQPVCIYFSRKGDCKHRSNCEYHHPKNQTAVSASCALSDKGLPLRPCQNICIQYSSYGICNSGPACKFDHPSLSNFLL